jgi:hypothetical protein
MVAPVRRSMAAGVVTAVVLSLGLAVIPVASEAAVATPVQSGRSAAAANGTAANTRAAASTAHPGPARTALAMLEQRARLAARAAAVKSSAARQTGTITGTMRGVNGEPVTGACVTAIGSAVSMTTTAAPNGRFVLGGLIPGNYVLEYRDCAAAGQYLTSWSGGVAWRSAAAPVQVTAGRVHHVPLLILKPLPGAALRSGPATFRQMLAAAAGRDLSATVAAKTGRITGLVTGNGKPLRGICVEDTPVNSGTGYGAVTGSNGRYTLRQVVPGRYYVVFASGFGCTSSSANWLQQAYRNDNNPFAELGQGATAVKVTSGHVARGIDAHLRRGGEISGTVTARSGRKLRGICVNGYGLVPHGSIGYSVRTSATGAYHLHALFPGKYYLSFSVGCGSRGNYAPASRRGIKIKYGQHRTANEVLGPGAGITGKVTLGSKSGKPLAGMCVYATNRDGSIYSQTATGRYGNYRVVGLGTGRYQVQIGPGCNNNGNYTSAIVTAHTTVGKVTSGRNAVLQPGAVISGTVTNVNGNPVSDMCIELAGSGAAFGAFLLNASPDGYSTGDDGSYVIGQLPAGTYEVGFSSGCGDSGNYAPYWYDDQTDPDLATPIVLATGASQTVNATLRPGATITGKVTSASGKKLSGICVYAATTSQAELGPVFTAWTETYHGTYTISGLAPGQYFVDFGCGEDRSYADQWFDGAGSAGSAELVSADAGRTSGISAVLRPAGSISGIVTGKSGHPLAGVCAEAISTRDRESQFLVIGEPVERPTNSHGAYLISGLAAGNYHVLFIPCSGSSRYAERWYRRHGSTSFQTAVRVRAGKRTSGINSRLSAGGTISGTAVGATGKPLRNICVYAFAGRTGYAGFATTSKAGTYKIAALPTSTYSVEFFPCGNRNLIPDISHAKVSAPHASTGINATLRPGGSISGVVTAAAGGAVSNSCVEVVSSDPDNPGSFAVTNDDGSYLADGLAAGTYQVYFGDPTCFFSPVNFAPQWYDNQPTEATATPVTVTVGQTTPSIDAALQPDGQITGIVSGPGGVPLAGICVTAIPSSADLAGSPRVVAVSRTGGYALTELVPGQYKVEFSSGCGASGYVRLWWQDASSQVAATVVNVDSTQVVSGISATMSN